MSHPSSDRQTLTDEIVRLRQRIRELEGNLADSQAQHIGHPRLDATSPLIPSPHSPATHSTGETAPKLAETLHRAEQRIRQQDAELAQALRLTTIGEMIAQISHEVNQPLHVISNFAHACLRELEKPEGGNREQVQDWLGRISQSATRASEVVRRIVAFVRRGQVDRQRLRLFPLIASSIEVAAWRAKRQGIEMRMEPFDVTAEIDADPIQMEQVFVNLLVNACDAMEGAQADSGQIVVRTVVAADSVEIAVDDSGCGIPAAIRDSLFNPFVTTKPAGLGLGLAICRTIVEGHGGRIWPTSQPHGGTTFHVQLPLVVAGEKMMDPKR